MLVRGVFRWQETQAKMTEEKEREIEEHRKQKDEQLNKVFFIQKVIK